MNSPIAAALGLSLAVCLLVGCDHRKDAGGPVTTETREVADFDSIEMEGAARLEITVGAKESVIVEAHDDIIARVKTEVHGDTLHIRSKPKDWFIADGKPRVTIRISVPELESLEVEGGNDVRLSGIDGGDTKIRAGGAVYIRAQGHLDELTVHLAGAGHADLSDLIANEVKVTVDGVGSVYVHPKDSLDATMNGVGAILYSGSPREVNTRMNGLGTIGQHKESDRRRNDDWNDKDADEPQPDEPVNPDTLQPEYEDTDQKKPVKDATEVI